jgi:hypothetical protein
MPTSGLRRDSAHNQPEQSLAAHSGQIAAMNADIGQVLRPNLTFFQGQRHRAFSEGRIRSTSTTLAR